MPPPPSWPADPSNPQHHSVPSVRVAQVKDQPGLTCAHVVPPTWVGVLWSVQSPTPSWPRSLSPQHQRVPSVRVAQVWKAPAETLAQVVAFPTCTGALRFVVV